MYFSLSLIGHVQRMHSDEMAKRKMENTPVRRRKLVNPRLDVQCCAGGYKKTKDY